MNIDLLLSVSTQSNQKNSAKLKHFFLFFVFLLSFVCGMNGELFAQRSEIIIGSGNERGTVLPVNVNYRYSYSQQILTAQEIMATGGMTGSIDGIGFQYVDTLSLQLDSVVILIGNTELVSFTDTSFIPAENLMTVYNGPVSFDSTGQNYWFHIPFDTLFRWDGQSNLVVAVLNNSGDSVGTTPGFLFHSLSENQCLHYGTSDTLIELDTLHTFVGNLAQRANIKLFVKEDQANNCDLLSVPYSQNFDACVAVSENVAGYRPDCWNVLTTGTAAASFPHVISDAGTNKMLLTSGNRDTYGADNYLIIPAFSNRLSDLFISFSSQMDNDFVGTLQLGYITDIENSTSFHLLSVVPTTDTLATYKYELNAYVIPTSAQLAFRWYNTDSCAHCKIDDILMDSLELCLTPTVSNIAVLSDTSVAISLTAGWNESHWLAEYGVTGFVRGTGDSVEIFSNNFVINGLTPSTKYDFYVQSLCDSVNSSNWSIVKRFTTPCEATTIPYYENFESYPATNYGVVGVIPTCWNLISGASNANYYSRISTYYAPYGNGLLMTSSSVTYGKNNYVVLPWFSSNLNGLKISFASKMDNATLGTLSLGYVTNIDADNSFVELQRFSNSTAIVPHNFSFENSVIPDGARIAFRWNFNMSLSMNCNIDNIAVEFIPCEPVDSVEVSNIMMTTADLSWKPGDDEPAWKVEYGVTGFTPGAGDTVLTVDTNYITLTNLIGNRTYDVYVRAACEEANQSPNSQAVTFTPYCITFADTVFESACDHFQWLDTTFTQSGIYVDTLYQAATYSCDSVVTLNLTIYPIYSQFDTLVICQNDLPYTWRDTVFEVGTDSNDFTFYRTTMNGCDSVVHLNLSVNPSYYPIENETICQNDLPYTWRDTIFEAGTQTGSYILFRHTENGCDSIVTLQLIVNPSYYQTEIEHICQNDLPYTWRDTTFQVGTISAVHTFYRHSQLGCDSIVTFVLMVKPAVDEIVTENICRSELPYTWRDTIFAEGTISGEYHFFRHARNSCDSTITLHLTVNESATENVVENICNTDLPYTWRDTTFEVGTVTGSYRFARQTTKGCDSLVTLSLNVNSAFYQDTTAVICQSELPFIFKDTVFYENTTSGIYRLPRQTAAGCDSVYTLNLTINPTYTDQLNLSICQNELPYTWRDTTFDVNTLTGDYSFIKSSIADCDSITTLHLTIYESYNETISLSVCENELPIAWRGNVIPHGTTTGVYTYNETSIHGCDSTVVLNLTVDPTYRQSENLTICRNDLPYMWRDTIFQVGSHSGTFLFETQSHTGCDSTVILKLTINDNYDFAETVTVCKSELPYTWRDTTFMNGTISDTYTFYRQSVNGCDSVVTLHLTVNETYYQTENAAICENDLPYTWRDTIFGIGTIDGDYHFARTTRNGCDSMVTLTLTVLPAYHSQITLDICQNELPYEWNDTVFGVGTPSGAYTFNHPSVAGCDSLLTLQLNVYPTYQQTEAMVICENELPYIWRDTTFQRGTSSGVYYFQNLSENGCDSLVTLALIVNPSYELEEETVICDNGFPFQWRDTVFEIGTTTNDYIFTRQSIKGCDSIVTLHLTVHPTYHQNVGLVICQNDLPYTWRDTTFEVGTHSRNFLFYKESQEGCDSIVTLTLTVNPSYEQVFNVEICENDFPYSWQDTTFLSGTESGTYIFHYTSISNCDSNIILNLTIHPSYRIDADLTICQSELPYQWGNIIFPIGTTNGEFLQTFVSQYGCDSIVNLALIVHPLYNLNERLSVCENDLPYTWRDTTFEIGTAGGTFIFRRNSEFGCDSVVTLTLNVNPNYTQSENVVICENDLPYTWRDTIFEVGTTDGLFTFNKTSISGCDSVVHLNLTVNPSYNINDALVICSQELPYTWEGHLFPVGTNSDDYVFYHTSIDGCDSIVTLSLTVNPSYEQSEEIDICANDFPFTWRDTTFEEGTQSGNFTFVRQTIAGCDSIVHLSLTINALPVFNILGNTTINLGQSTMLVATFGVGNSYIWSNGDQGNVINVSPTENTTYQVTVTNAAGCSASDSVLVTVIDTIGICDNKLETNIMLYPNPATVNVTIKTDREVMNSVEIYNMLGALVRRVGVQQNEAVIEISDLQKGSYVLRILMQNGDIARKKLIIE